MVITTSKKVFAYHTKFSIAIPTPMRYKLNPGTRVQRTYRIRLVPYAIQNGYNDMQKLPAYRTIQHGQVEVFLTPIVQYPIAPPISLKQT
jgi:hypothetical protein